MGMDLKEDDYIEHLFVASTHDYVLFFTSVGKVYRLKVHELPLGSRQSKGRAIVNLLPFRQDEQVRAVIQTRDFERGRVPALRDEERRGQEDEARRVQHAAQGRRDHRDQDARGRRARRACATARRGDDVLLVSRKGQAIRFNEKDARAMGRATEGVRGMRCAASDEVIAAEIAADDSDLLVVTENGYGKRTRVSEYPRKGRGGLGVQTVKLTEARGQLAGARVVRDGYQLMLISTGGTVIKMPVEDVKRLGRSTQGVIVMRLARGRDRLDARAGRRQLRRRRRRGRRGPRRSPAERREPTASLARSRRRARARTDDDPPNSRSADPRTVFPFARTALSSDAFGRAPIWRGSGDGLHEAGRTSSSRSTSAQHLDKVELYLGQVCRARRHLEDAARLLDEQGADPDQGQEAADLRHGRRRDRDADQAGQGQGPEPRRRDRRRTPLPRAAGRGSRPAERHRSRTALAGGRRAGLAARAP